LKSEKLGDLDFLFRIQPATDQLINLFLIIYDKQSDLKFQKAYFNLPPFKEKTIDIDDTY
jgi:hypothetical protein